MLNRTLYLLISLLFLGCTQIEDSKNDLNWTKPDLEGHWKLIDTEIVDTVPFLNLYFPEPDPMRAIGEGSPWDSYLDMDIVFENDSMYTVNYPTQAFSPVQYFLDTGYLHVGPKDDIYAYSAELVNDTLLFYRPLWSEEGFFKETFVQTSFNDSILDVMKKYGINYPELTDTWMLVREDDFDYGTHYELNFPHTLPDSIVFSREQMITALGNDKIYMMNTDGVKRDYTFFYRRPNIYFEPGTWYKGGEAMIYFERKYW